MTSGVRKRQRGLSLPGLIVVVIIVVGGIVLGMRVVPSITEYMAIERALKRVAGESGKSAREIRIAFDNYSAIDDFRAIGGKDLVITPTASGTLIAYSYEKRIPLVGPASLLLSFEGEAVQR